MKDKYRNLCSIEKSIPIFSRDWWLDAVAGEKNWDVVIIEKGGKIQASLPYVVKRRYGFTLLTTPPLTQTLGPWIRDNNGKYATKMAREKELLTSLIGALPKFDHYSQNWHYSRNNWLPFYWEGYKQTTKYTYRLNNLADLDVVWSNFQDNIRREIRKATDRCHLRIRDDVSVQDFLSLNKLVFKRQGIRLPYSDLLPITIDTACSLRDSRKIFIAEDADGKCHAAVYIIWDETSAYYLMSGADPELRNSGATSFCMWEAIKHAAKVTKSFDFEGSMIEPVERYFRAFGAKQTPYFSITKTPSRILEARYCLKRMIERL